MAKTNQNKKVPIVQDLTKSVTPWYKNRFYITIFCLSVFRLWLTSDIRLIGIPSTTDDFHYVITAYYNKMGQWLGPLDQYTLHTLPFFAVFLATLSKFKIPLLFANHFLYVSSWVFGIFTLRQFIKKDWILIFIFTLVVFQPMTYAGDVCRVVREGMWVPCAIFILFCYIRMFFIETKFYIKLIYSSVIGLLVSAFYLTREDGLMIYPLMLFLIASFLWTERKNIKTNWLKMSVLIILPFIILQLSCWNIVRLNKKYYKADFLFENKMKESVEFYSVLNSLKQNKKIERISLTTENRIKLYELSPTFGQLKPYDQIFQGWSEQSGEVKGECVHFGTALKTVLNYAGYYSSFSNVKIFYKNLTQDLEKLVDNGTFQKTKPHAYQKFIPFVDLNKINTEDILAKTIECFAVTVTLDDFKLLDSHEFGQYTYGNEQTIAILKEITSNKLAYTEQEATPEVKSAYENSLKNIILATNYSLYKISTLITFILCIVGLSYLVFVKKTFQNKQVVLIVVISAALVFFIRIFMLGLLCSSGAVCLFSVKYLSIAYPFMYLFIGISLSLFVDSFFKLKSNEKK